MDKKISNKTLKTSADQLDEQPENKPRGAEKLPSSFRGAGKITSFVLIVILIGLLAWAMGRNLQGRVQEGPAPDFSLIGFGGDTIRLSDLRGQVVVVNFWASWCPPCREEAPYLEETWRKYQNNGVVFIGVDYVDVEPAALAYIEEFNITYFNGPDLRTTISQAYNIQGVPETFFIDKTGNISHVHVGPLITPDLEQQIDKLISEDYPGD
ncbi:MAG: TlpA family protein disulfide reductase [Chloroflexi bacterium]|nr:TlpA family protein disulfide reductase [Chloroflexota bacterium]